MSITGQDLLDKLLELQSQGISLENVALECTKKTYIGYQAGLGETFDEESFVPTDMELIYDGSILSLTTTD